MEINLTEKEKILYDSIKQGMDNPGEGWLHEITPFNSHHVTAGVLGSLISKNLVRSDEVCEPGSPTCFWVTLAQ